MDAGEALVRRANMAMRRDRRRSLWQSISKYRLAGGPTPRTRPGVGFAAWSFLAGGNGPQITAPFGGQIQIPEVLRATERTTPRPHASAGCVHCSGQDLPLRGGQWMVGLPAGPLASTGPLGRGVVRFGGIPDGLPTASSTGGSFETGLDEAAVPTFPSLPNSIVDAHAHLFPGTAIDLATTLREAVFGRWADTDNADRINWLGGYLASRGVSQAVLSGFLDGSIYPPPSPDYRVGEGPDGAASVDLAVQLAALGYPGFFAPLLTGMHVGEADPANAYFEPALAAWSGWKGIGEIIVHGHGSNLDDDATTEKLINILKVAEAHGVPVLLHWDMGAVDSADSPAADNFTQFTKVIDAVPDAVVVLAHCGLGPGDDIANGGDGYLEWTERFTGNADDPGLLSRPNLYFDVAGMQVADVAQLMNDRLTKPTDAGAFLLEQMGTYPTRFMVATDVETRSFYNKPASESYDLMSHAGVETFALSVSNYITYLQFGVDNGYFDQATMDRVRGWNAKEVYDF